MPQKRISFVEDEKGFHCQSCNKPILSAERKNQKLIPIIAIAMIPFLIIGLGSEISYTLEYLVKFLAFLILSITLMFLGIYRMHHNIEYICEDKSSDKYNQDSIHV